MSLVFHLASASGNAFAYLWEDEATAPFDGPLWSRFLCLKGRGLALDGVFLLARPTAGSAWRMEHWDADGSPSFCSNGTRAALALPGAPGDAEIEVLSNGVPVELRRGPGGPGIRLPEGPSYGLQQVELGLPEPHAYGWVGNPQLVLEKADLEQLDLGSFAPRLRHHPAFPEGANVNVVTLTREGEARIRSWERGVEGETLCCGTGCAVAGAWLAARTGRRGWTFRPAGEDPVHVEVGSMSEGAWRGLWLSGPVRYSGRLLPGTPSPG